MNDTITLTPHHVSKGDFVLNTYNNKVGVLWFKFSADSKCFVYYPCWNKVGKTPTHLVVKISEAEFNARNL